MPRQKSTHVDSPAAVGERLKVARARAEVALWLDEFGVAEELYRQCLEGSPSDAEKAEAYGGLGQLAFRRGDPRSAIKLLESAGDFPLADQARRAAIAETLGRAYA